MSIIEENKKLSATIDGLHEELGAKVNEVRDLTVIINNLYKEFNFDPELTLGENIRLASKTLKSKEASLERALAWKRLLEQSNAESQKKIDELNANLTAATNSINNVSETYGLDGEGSFTEQVGRAIAASAPHAPEGYGPLKKVLDDALSQAAFGKGVERHGNGKSFVEQPMITISQTLGSPDGMAYQVCKKVTEARGLPTRKARINELLGAIVYTAGMVVFEELQPEDDTSPLAINLSVAVSKGLAENVRRYLDEIEYVLNDARERTPNFFRKTTE